jgi:hypothetical protein
MESLVLGIRCEKQYLQIAHIIEQLIGKGSLLRQVFPKGVGSGRNLAFSLLEAWRNVLFGKALLGAGASCRFEIRFCPDTA